MLFWGGQLAPVWHRCTLKVDPDSTFQDHPFRSEEQGDFGGGIFWKPDWGVEGSCCKVKRRMGKPSQKRTSDLCAGGVDEAGLHITVTGKCVQGSFLQLLSVYNGCPFGDTRNISPTSNRRKEARTWFPNLDSEGRKGPGSPVVELFRVTRNKALQQLKTCLHLCRIFPESSTP